MRRISSATRGEVQRVGVHCVRGLRRALGVDRQLHLARPEVGLAFYDGQHDLEVDLRVGQVTGLAHHLGEHAEQHPDGRVLLPLEVERGVEVDAVLNHALEVVVLRHGDVAAELVLGEDEVVPHGVQVHLANTRCTRSAVYREKVHGVSRLVHCVWPWGPPSSSRGRCPSPASAAAGPASAANRGPLRYAAARQRRRGRPRRPSRQS